MRKYVLYGGAVVAAVLTLQAILPHRLEEGRSTEVLGKLNFHLKWRPRGIALAQLGDSFSWDEVCVVRESVLPEEFAQDAGIEFPSALTLAEGPEGWLLVFVKDKRAVAATKVPRQSIGAIDLASPYSCVTDPDAFFQLIESDDPQGPPRRFKLRT